MLRAREVARFVRRLDPYLLPDMTYPPTAPPILTPLIAPFGPETLKPAWLALNLVALAVVCATIVGAWGRRWPSWVRASFVLAVLACKPVRGGMALGQFHLIPTALVLLAIVAGERGKAAFAGLLMGLALTKPTIALPFLGIWAARGRWRALATALGFQGVVMVGVSAWLRVGPITLLREWFANARGQLGSGVLDAPTLAHRAWPGSPWVGTLLSATILAAALIATIAWRRKPTLGLVGVSAAAAATFTYHRGYDLVLLVPVLACLVEKAVSGGDRGQIAGAMAFGALLIVPNNPGVSGTLAAAYQVAFAPIALAALAWAMVEIARMPEAYPPATFAWER